jgi:hypothetical protein
MKIYPSNLLNEDKARIETSLYITEEEALNLVSMLAKIVLDYRTMGIEYEIRLPSEIFHRVVGGENQAAKGELVIRFDRPKR